MRGGCREVGLGPGHAVRGAASHTSDFEFFKALDQLRAAIDRGSGIPLLAMVIVPPGENLDAKEKVYRLN